MKQTFATIVRACKLAWGATPWTSFILIVLHALIALLPLVQAKVTGSVIDSVVSSLSHGVGVPVMLVALYGIVWVTTRLAQAVRGFFDKRWHLSAQDEVDMTVMRARTKIDLAHHENAEFQNLMTRAFNRSNFPIITLADIQFDNIGLIIGIIGSAALALSYPLIFVIVVGSLIPSFMVEVRYGNKKWNIWSENSPRQRMYGTIRGHINGKIGIIQTKMLQAADNLIERARGILASFREEQFKVDRADFTWRVVASLIGAVGVGTAFYLIVQSVIRGEAGVGDIVFLTGVLAQFAGLSTNLLSSIARMYESTLYAKDIFSVLDTKPAIAVSAHPVALNLTSAPTIEFKNVSFKYTGSEVWAIKDVSLTIKPGEKLALVGENGAGKTTLLKLLSRIYDPTEGEILVNGISLRDIHPDEWGSYLAILLQDYRIHEFSVAESIAMGRPDGEVSQARAKQAAELAGAHEFITELADGYEAQIGREFANGIELSKGQEQRVALARTLYREGFVVILDEPTASVDSIAEERFFNQIEQAVSEKTLLLISHRFNTVHGADRIAVFDHGTLVELGSHHDLLNKKDGHYKKMWESQAKSYVEAIS